jgi:hypothetical protein
MCNGPLQLPRRRARGRTAKELDLKDVLLTGGMLDFMGSFRGNCLHMETANATASDVSTPCTPGPGTTDYCGGRSVSPNPNQEHRRAQEPRLACALRTPCAQCSSVSRRSLSHPQESGVFALAVVTLRLGEAVRSACAAAVEGRSRRPTTRCYEPPSSLRAARSSRDKQTTSQRVCESRGRVGAGAGCWVEDATTVRT